jgi:hypothetical protein
MLLAGGIGVWNFELSRIPLLGTACWLWAFFSWPLCMYGAGFLSSIVSRSSTQLDGALHGIVVWAASCFFATSFFLYFAGNLLEDLPANVASPILWGFMVADLTAFGAALAGGVNGALSEFKIEVLEDSSREPAPSAPLDQAMART